MKDRISFGFFFIAVFFMLSASTHAQTGTALFLNISPQYPVPGEPVFITLQSPLYSLSERVITWRQAGATLLEGEGETSVRIIAPTAGQAVTVTALINDSDDSASITIAPASIDLMWEADSYAPGLYRGRHLPAIGSNVTLQAIPHILKGGVEVPANQLIYTWRRSGNVIPTASGRGKSSYTYRVPLFSSADTISVSAVTADKSGAAEVSTRISTYEPSIHLYFEHPLYGTMYHNSLKNSTAISDSEMSFAAVPYFIVATEPNDSRFSYIWRVNKQEIDEHPTRPNTLVVNAGEGGGDALIELSLTHSEDYVFDGRGAWSVSFGSLSGNSSGAQTSF